MTDNVDGIGARELHGLAKIVITGSIIIDGNGHASRIEFSSYGENVSQGKGQLVSAVSHRSRVRVRRQSLGKVESNSATR